MEKTKQTQAEKLQIKLDKLLQTKEKKKTAFEKSKQELNAVSKEIDSVKLKLFEILQSGSDDSAFSEWAKRKIGENEKTAKTESGNSANSEKPIMQNHQNRQSPTGQNQQLNANQNRPPHSAQNPNQRQ